MDSRAVPGVPSKARGVVLGVVLEISSVNVIGFEYNGSRIQSTVFEIPLEIADLTLFEDIAASISTRELAHETLDRVGLVFSDNKRWKITHDDFPRARF